MEGLGRRNGAFGPIVEMAIPMNDRVCWFGDGVSCASDFHLRFYGRFADLHKLHALHVRLSRPCNARSMALWRKSHRPPLRRNATFAKKPSCFFRQLPFGGGRGQFMRFFSTEGALSCAIVREFEKRRFPIRFTFGTAAPQS